MRDVNGWLMALAFLLGLALTFALMIRTVTREVPVNHTVSAGLKGRVDTPDVDTPDVKAPDLGKVAGAVIGAGAAAATGTAATLSGAADSVAEKVDSVLEKDPYGSGSIRVSSRTAAPLGYTIKGDKDTMRYFTAESPDYEAIEAEVWFANEASAEAAGFLRWDGKGGAASATTAVITGVATTVAAAKFASTADVPAGPYGKVSASANADGSGPTGWTIKGNADSMLYHTTDSRWYGQTIAEVWFADEESARKAGFTRWDAKKGDGGAAAKIASIADVPAGPYGKGSATAEADGSGPTGWLIKGNADSMLFHGTDSPAYEQTIAEVWFFDEKTARAAGFDKWDKNFT